MKNCEYCKSAMPDDAIKCPACGAHVKNIEVTPQVGLNDELENPVKERMTKKQIGLLIAACIISVIAFAINVVAAVFFGSAAVSTGDESAVGTIVAFIILLPLWFIFGCTTAGAAIIYDLCIMTSLEKKWFIPFILALAVAAVLIVVIIEIFCVQSSSSSETAFVLQSLATCFKTSF